MYFSVFRVFWPHSRNISGIQKSRKNIQYKHRIFQYENNACANVFISNVRNFLDFPHYMLLFCGIGHDALL